ncbi:MAG: hypothetical protein NT092_03070 [Bacteroidia bacterium]|nr:hypothetical protein [Bacteroidia bacterium]
MKATSFRLFAAIVVLLISSSIPGNELNCQEENLNPLPQYLFPSFAKGVIHMKDGRELAAVLNYNMVDQEMVFQQGKYYMVLDKPEEIYSILLQNRRFEYVEKVFYEVVSEGTVTLYIQHKSKYAPVGNTGAYGTKSQTSATINVTTVQGGNQVRFLDVPDNVTISPATVYWAKINGEMEKFTSEKQLLKLFPERETELKEFIKSTGADIKTREGLMQVGNFLNGTK